MLCLALTGHSQKIHKQYLLFLLWVILCRNLKSEDCCVKKKEQRTQTLVVSIDSRESGYRGMSKSPSSFRNIQWGISDYPFIVLKHICTKKNPKKNYKNPLKVQTKYRSLRTYIHRCIHTLIGIFMCTYRHICTCLP